MAAQREVRRFKRGPEGIWIGTDDLLEQIDLVDDEPTPEMAAVLNEAIGLRLRALAQPELRQIAVLNLEGWTNHEIAQELRCTERSIERKLGLIRKRWEQPGRIAYCYDRTDPKKGP